MTKRLSMSIAAVALLVSVVASAQQPATVLLRSGERISGDFEDIHNGLVYIRASLHDERRIPVDQVALIDFVGGAQGLPETELVAARGPEDLLLLKDGTSLVGELVDVTRPGEGQTTIPGAPIEVIFRASDGSLRRIAIEQVGRLYLGELPPNLGSVPGAVATTGSNPPQASSRFGPNQAGFVPANAQWTPTGLMVEQGQPVWFHATGEIRLGEGLMAGPAGSKLQRDDARAPLPQEFVGALIARVDGAEPFAIGDQRGPLRMPASGQLYLGVNVPPDELANSQGGFYVTVRPAERRRR